MFTISPKNEVIEALIEEFKSGHITTIYGNSASGRTTCCLLAAIEVVENKGKVIYVDTGSGFDVKRFRQLGGNKEYLDNIFLLQPKSFDEQGKLIEKLHKLCENEKIKLVIVDTIGSYYRLNLGKNPKKVNKQLLEQLITLVRIARDLDKVVLMTNQVYADMNDEDKNIKMVGGNLTHKMSKYLIELEKKDDERIACLVRYKMDKDNVTHHNLNKKVKFEIREEGMFLI